jgi:hypothetical protein
VIETCGVPLTGCRAFLQKLLLALFFLQLEAVFSLQPTLGGFIFVSRFVFLELGNEISETTDVCGLPLSWRVVGRWYEP